MGISGPGTIPDEDFFAPSPLLLHEFIVKKSNDKAVILNIFMVIFFQLLIKSMSLNDYICKFIQKEAILSGNKKVLLAVSGGVDSMVLLHLIMAQKIDFGVAHVNYKLRVQSDDEEKLLNCYCADRNIALHIYVASREQMDDLKSGNLQSKARTIRYSFFEKVMIEHGYTHLMTAHHMDDEIEGFFLNLFRGAGLQGLSGMVESGHQLLRPLLKITKEELLRYAQQNQVSYLQDESNFDSTYDRNFIRNEILPIVKQRFPHYQKTVSKSLENLKSTNELLNYFSQNEKIKYVSCNDKITVLDHFNELKRIPGCETFLLLIVKEFGFNRADVHDMLNAQSTGSLFISDSHEALFDRGRLLIKRRKKSEWTDITILEYGRYIISDNQFLRLEEVYSYNGETHKKNCEYFDLEKLKFPIKIRHWEPGDRFCPLGVHGQSRKVKDYLTDEKISRFEKSEIKVAESRGEIIWVLGCRMDDRFKITDETSRILMMDISERKSPH